MPDTGAGMLPPASPTLSKRSGSSSMPGTNAASRSTGPRHQNRSSPSHALNHFANATLGGREGHAVSPAGSRLLSCCAALPNIRSCEGVGMPGALEDGGRPIEQAPAWIGDLMTPAGELTAMRRLALRYLAGDSVPV